jgi:hypothetical protein
MTRRVLGALSAPAIALARLVFAQRLPAKHPGGGTPVASRHSSDSGSMSTATPRRHRPS